MQKRNLGSSGIQVSIVGLGTVKFGRNQGVKYPCAFELPSDQDVEELLAVAAGLGINLLDTAPAYGASEERLGKSLRGRRHEWVICTKAGEEFIDGQSSYDFSPHALTHSVERSMRRLQTDYLDVVLVHSNGDDMRIIEQDQAFDTLEMLKRAGKIRAYGMSTKTIDGGLKTVEFADVAMVTFNPSCVEDREVIASAHRKQKGIFIKKAFASGHASKDPGGNLRFVFAESGVTSVIIGTINPAHLRENVESCKVVGSIP
ncbi:General stress protein 69 [Aquicella siphonis]|uniref:General stress protein 69 n=1 Tax=Aquicella siphonis TaxID=254247 RepID=A0A5E4PKX2_9COXI|nr:aldo/keto reductase [Aquicella siphonis]VVC76856.1 General stress protein 69 [Aquicella siphonis]